MSPQALCIRHVLLKRMSVGLSSLPQALHVRLFLCGRGLRSRGLDLHLETERRLSSRRRAPLALRLVFSVFLLFILANLGGLALRRLERLRVGRFEREDFGFDSLGRVFTRRRLELRAWLRDLVLSARSFREETACDLLLVAR